MMPIQMMKRSLIPFSLFVLFSMAIMQTYSVRATEGNTGVDTPEYPMDWRMSGPSGGDVRALVVDPNDPQRFYFGTLDGQIYTSVDGGQQWSLFVNFNRPKLFIDNIIVDPRNSRILYVAAHRHTEPGGFFRTSDGGKTWRESTELRGEAVHSLFQAEANRDLLFAGTSSGVYRSDNSGGESWVHLPTTGMINRNVESLAVDPRNTNLIYAGTWHRMFKSTDAGQTWRLIKDGMIDDSDVFAINIDPRDANHIIASACSGIYESRNAGEQWRKVQGIPSQSRRTRAILQHPSVAGVVFAGTTEGFWRSTNGGSSWMLTTSKQLEVNSIEVHPRNADIVYIGTNNYGVMVSRDGGRSFTPSNNGYSGRFVNALVSDRDRQGRIYASTINTTTGGGFFYVSSDGGSSWQPSMRNLPNRLITYSILQDEKDSNVLYLGTNLGIYRSNDRGASWATIGAPRITAPSKGKKKRPVKPTVSSSVTGAALRSNDMIKRAQEALNASGFNVGVADGRAGTSTVAQLRKFQADKGIAVTGKFDSATLTALGLGGVVSAGNESAKVPVAVVALSDTINALSSTYDERDGKSGILAATNAGLYRTYDPARGWERLSYGSGLDPRTTSVSSSAQNPSTIWAGTVTSGVLVSRNGGQSWQQAAGIPGSAPISSIAQDPQRSAYVYVGTKQTLYVSHDGGEKWRRRGGDLPYGDYASILINPENGNEIFVGNAWEKGGGVYRSTNGGDTWSRIDPRDSRLPSQRIWALAFARQDQNRIFIGSHSAGVYVANRSSGTALKVER